MRRNVSKDHGSRWYKMRCPQRKLLLWSLITEGRTSREMTRWGFGANWELRYSIKEMERASASGSSLPLCSITRAVRTCFSVVIDGFSILREAFTIRFSPLLWLDLRQTLNSRRFIFRHTLSPAPHLWSKIRQRNNKSLGCLILVAIFPLCTLHSEPSASHYSCLRIGLSLPFLPLPTLHLEIKISLTQGPFCTICSVITGALVLCKMPGLNNGMRWFVSSSWSAKPWAQDFRNFLQKQWRKFWGTVFFVP